MGKRVQLIVNYGAKLKYKIKYKILMLHLSWILSLAK